MEVKKEIAVFGGGCFWCTEAVFTMLKGVLSVTSGYAGGGKEDPTYEEVSGGKTGHAEVIKVEFDPSQVMYESLLAVFFASHDPTILNRQGPDIGSEYRSLILYADEKQKNISENYIAELKASLPDGYKIVTEVKPLEKFYEAEEYHKQYYQKNSSNFYCKVVIEPKLQKVKERFASLLALQK
ncbi:MAG: peptide-methionine (S)-S-oxide reductase MsrA [bacterium]|nr:peptide-methionine (S)-S-oxide reductase MsrA [Candidatus Wildermuthbacteria bacterium]MDP2664808.1 peptide-methionine (S)-S-oxide reductase MsrA [bacterium]